MIGAALLAASALAFDVGADLRIRQELIHHAPRGVDYKNHIRFRPRVWAEVKGESEAAGKWRVYTRLADEFRWNVKPHAENTAWPGEVIFDNLFVEGKDLFDGKLDVKLGRQDLMNYCGLGHVFMDGTPGDGSRTVYTDMAALKFKVDDVSTLDLFGLYNLDSAHDFRWGDDQRRLTGLSARYGDGSGEQDDWGYGAIWGSEFNKNLKYQVFFAGKQTCHQHYAKDHTELVGVKLMPQWSETLSSSFEAMSELDDEYSAYADIKWKSTRQGVKPFASASYHYMSEKWDPMWGRGVNDSELFLYGTHDGSAWWSNMHFLKFTAGLEFSRAHALTASTGPMWAARDDGVGGGDGKFKGVLTQGKYEFPLYLADKAKGERLEVLGHVVAEFFNPGEYYSQDKTGWFVRWQVEIRF